MKLVIAEKPELAKDIVKAMMKNPIKKEGYYEDKNYTVTYSYGHVLELADPEEYDKKYENRKDETLLPIYFQNWKKKAGKDPYVKKQLSILGTLIKDPKYEAVIHAGDPDEEGQNIVDELLEYFSYKGTVYRVFINDSIEKHIQDEFLNLKINDEKMRAIGESAYARQMADKAFGINESRLATIRLNSFVSIGRVQTPTLGLVVHRDEAIKNHQKRYYYDLNITMNLRKDNENIENVIFKWKPAPHILDNEKHIYDKEVLNKVKEHLIGLQTSCVVEEKEEYQYPPLPYNQTELSADMNTFYGYTLKQTLDITQNLRDKFKIISYNRSDCQYLKEEHFEEAEEVLNTVFTNLNKKYVVNFNKKPKCFKSDKVTAHHGIIPVNQAVDFGKLSKEEKNVYQSICERYIMQFMKPLKRTVSTCEIKQEDGIIYYCQKKVVEEGYFEFFGNKKEEEKGVYIQAGKYDTEIKDIKIIEKETTPLKKYTPATLVKDMCSISKYVKDEEIKRILKEKDKDKEGEKGSIGTVATRASIVEVLIKRGYLKMDGKYIVTTELGREFYHLLPQDIKSADVTARWWLIQEDIKQGKADKNTLLNKIVADFKERQKNAYNEKQLNVKMEKESIGSCPFCGKSIYEANTKKGIFWYCSDYKNGCQFKMFEETKRFQDIIKLTRNKVKSLLNGKSIKVILTSKEGKLYSTYLKMQINGNYINFIKDKKE